MPALRSEDSASRLTDCEIANKEVIVPLEPSPYVRPAIAAPTGHWLTRAFSALLIERRLPTRVAVVWDRLCNAVGLRRKTVCAGGFRVRLRRQTCDENFVHNVLLNNEYTPPGYEIHESDVVIDIGGNIGTFALHAARCASRGKVFTFEPNGENYQLLVRNIALNKARNILPMRAAIAAQRGTIKLYSSTEGGGFHSVLEDRMSDARRYELVDTVALKDVFVENAIERCHFLKIDCEGAEYDILYNLPADYFARIDRIAMEYHGVADATQRRAQSDELVAYLEHRGFRIDAYEEFVGFRGGFIRATRQEGRR
jgi:FkbM family methyltransferase